MFFLKATHVLTNLYDLHFALNCSSLTKNCTAVIITGFNQIRLNSFVCRVLTNILFVCLDFRTIRRAKVKKTPIEKTRKLNLRMRRLLDLPSLKPKTYSSLFFLIIIYF